MTDRGAPTRRGMETGDAAAAAMRPIGLGLLTKLNVLTVGLIFVTAVTTTGFYLWQQWREGERELRGQGSTVLAMLSALAEHGIATGDPRYLQNVLDTLDQGGDIAAASVLDASRHVLARRRFGTAFAEGGVPPVDPATLPTRNAPVAMTLRTVNGLRYLELMTAVLPGKPRAPMVNSPCASLRRRNLAASSWKQAHAVKHPKQPCGGSCRRCATVAAWSS